jgi:hypothetical protein
MPKIKKLNHEGHPELNKRTYLTGQAKKKWNEKKSGDEKKRSQKVYIADFGMRIAD